MLLGKRAITPRSTYPLPALTAAAIVRKNAWWLIVRHFNDKEINMKSDGDIQRDVIDELQWDPDVDASNIAVSVKGGVVEWAGYVRIRQI